MPNLSGRGTIYSRVFLNWLALLVARLRSFSVVDPLVNVRWHVATFSTVTVWGRISVYSLCS